MARVTMLGGVLLGGAKRGRAGPQGRRPAASCQARADKRAERANRGGSVRQSRSTRGRSGRAAERDPLLAMEERHRRTAEKRARRLREAHEAPACLEA